MLDDVVEELTSADILHNHEDVGGGADHLVAEQEKEMEIRGH